MLDYLSLDVIRTLIRELRVSGENIRTDGKVSDVSELGKSSNLSHNKSYKRPDQAANWEAKSVLGHLGKSLAVSNDNNTNIEEKLDGLKNVHAMASFFPVNAEAHVTKGFHRVLVGV